MYGSFLRVIIQGNVKKATKPLCSFFDRHLLMYHSAGTGNRQAGGTRQQRLRRPSRAPRSRSQSMVLVFVGLTLLSSLCTTSSFNIFFIKQQSPQKKWSEASKASRKGGKARSKARKRALREAAKAAEVAQARMTSPWMSKPRLSSRIASGMAAFTPLSPWRWEHRAQILSTRDMHS